METVDLFERKIPVRAYLHATADHCVTAAPGGEWVYSNPRKLVDVNDLTDPIEWLEKGLHEWRSEALLAKKSCATLVEVIEWLISNEPEDSPKRGVLVARAAIADAKRKLSGAGGVT